MINLTLHGVGKPNRPLGPHEANFWLSIDSLEDILDVLRGLDSVILTVDDGNKSDVEIVMPVLLRKGMKAIFFIPPGKLGQSGYLDRKDIQSLIRKGMTVGTHGMYHRAWRTLNDHDLKVEIYESMRILQDITGRAVELAACPFGSYDRRVLRHLRRAELIKVYTSDGGHTRSKWWLQPRNSLHSNDDGSVVTTMVTQSIPMRERLLRDPKMLVKRWT